MANAGREVPFAGFCGGSNRYFNDLNLDGQLSMNWYPDIVENTGRDTVAVMRPTIGVQSVTQFPDNIRCIYTASTGIGTVMKTLFVVAGQNVMWSINGEEWHICGQITSTTDRVEMTDNGHQLFIADGRYGYYVDFTAENPAVVKISNEQPDPDTPADINFYPRMCTTVGPYIVAAGEWIEGTEDVNTNRWYFTEIYDCKTWPVLNYERSVSFFSSVKGLASMAGTLWVFGDDGIEAWQTTGNNLDAFAKQQGGYSGGCGLLSEEGHVNDGQTLAWIGTGERGNAIIYTINSNGGFQPKRVSTAAIETAIEKLPDIKDCVASHYSEYGHSFFSFTFPVSDLTICYDATTGMWHHRSRAADGDMDFHKALGYKEQTLYDTVYACDLRESPNLYIHKGYTYDGRPVSRKRVTPTINAAMKRSIHYCLTIDTQVNNEQDINKDMNWMLRFSDDGGYTWSSKIYKNLGKGGEYKKILQFRGLGEARRRAYELSLSDPSGVAITDAFITLENSRSRA
jgi:hypothetical protein